MIPIHRDHGVWGSCTNPLATPHEQLAGMGKEQQQLRVQCCTLSCYYYYDILFLELREAHKTGLLIDCY